VVSQDAIQFLNTLGTALNDEQRLILCGFTGDPNAAQPGDWKPRPWQPGRDLPFGRSNNAYVTVASFGRAADGSFRRRSETFAAGLALMVDDVGTKVPLTVVAHCPPTAIVETSPKNFQWWYFLSEPELSRERFGGVIKAFIAGKLLGNDPGMAGINRVGRLPDFINGKAAYGGAFRTRLVDWHPERRWTIDQLLKAFGLTIVLSNRMDRVPEDEVLEARAEAFNVVEAWLEAHHMFKKARPDLAGWREMTCPWVDEHTAGANTGAAIRIPAPENGFWGSFKCHHGHCAANGWSALCDWVSEHATESNAERNRSAPATLREALGKGRR
jgi:hypothetical protein